VGQAEQPREGHMAAPQQDSHHHCPVFEVGTGVEPALWCSDLAHSKNFLNVGQRHGYVASKEAFLGAQAFIDGIYVGGRKGGKLPNNLPLAEGIFAGAHPH
jgi:hypothetical protein